MTESQKSIDTAEVFEWEVFTGRRLTPGRPRVGQTFLIRMPPDLKAALVAQAKTEGVAELCRRLLRDGLAVPRSGDGRYVCLDAIVCDAHDAATTYGWMDDDA